jgi:hypothetical protein
MLQTVLEWLQFEIVLENKFVYWYIPTSAFSVSDLFILRNIPSVHVTFLYTRGSFCAPHPIRAHFPLSTS